MRFKAKFITTMLIKTILIKTMLITIMVAVENMLWKEDLPCCWGTFILTPPWMTGRIL